jgi:3-dehydroquinate synthase
MRTATSTRDEGFRVRDEVPLPTSDAPIIAHAVRKDEYPIYVTRTLSRAVEHLVAIVEGAQLAIITDTRVDELYGDALREALDDAGLRHQTYRLSPGEPSKSRTCHDELIDWLAASEISRRDFIVTFGGGVINDTGGYAASAYMRGLRYINLPTTVLAQVDGAMGGKVAVNHSTAKNLIGAFYQPAAVISNVAFLETLDRRNLAAGLAESIKKAIIASPEYWEFINTNAERMMDGDLDALEHLVRSAAEIKTLLVERDPYEEDLRRPLNFGHTVGHPLETLCGYGTLLHGEAVAFGMVVETQIAANRGLLQEPLTDMLGELLRRVHLPDRGGCLPDEVHLGALRHAMLPVARIRDGSFLYVLPERCGSTIIASGVTWEELDTAATQIGVRPCGTH